jgi:6-pyruvoyltetrahydropterin/6-carboxytetrahydropterin synthase
MHGHNWRVRITIRLDAGELDSRSMGLDFRDLQAITAQCVEDFEHRYLNDLDAFRAQPPTAEMLARVVAERAATRLGQIPSTARVEEVEVWEVPEYRVTYRPD